MAERQDLQVVAGVILRDGRVLLAKRPRGPLKGLWEFPGGKREEGEGLAECLERELWEELGINVKVLDLICKTDSEGLSLFFYLCVVEGGDPVPREGQETEWVKIDALKDLELAPPDKLVVEEITRRLKGYVQEEKGCGLSSS